MQLCSSKDVTKQVDARRTTPQKRAGQSTELPSSRSKPQQLDLTLPPTPEIMAPKGKGGDKGKIADKGAEKKAGAQKGAQSINVRHILCAKHAKKEEALKKLNDGVAFNKVAEEYSEDKARAGEMIYGVS
jgi:parvulin-like peptidyl-prolyl isomerase